METAKKGLDRESWLDEIHKSAPDVSWKKIEEENRFNSYKKSLTSNGSENLKDKTVNIANGYIIAEWNEKGSNNLSGSITYMEYDSLNNQFYSISAGGSLWNYRFDGLGWRLINDKLKFDNRFLKITHPTENETRIVCSISGKPFYSADGIEWTLSGGPQVLSGGRVKNVKSLQKGRFIFYLIDEGAQKNLKLYYSEDFGSSFNTLSSFNSSDLDNFSIDVCKRTNQLICIEQKSITQSKIYEWNTNTKNFELITDSSPLSFGAEGRGNIRSRYQNSQLVLFSYNGNNDYYRSKDLGVSWTKLSSLPVAPWQDGIFVSYSDPNLMIISEVEAHVSRDGGLTWVKVNSWNEYYSNPLTKLHADMMHIDEFDNGFSDIITIANHGGVNLSYDKLISNNSIAQINLNISQYYSVRTYPLNPDVIFAGSQDQGIQRGYDLGEGTVSFTQLFSGDYGHISFTNFNKSMWIVYPGGWIFYFDDPINQNFSSFNYQLDSKDESVWLPPIISSPYHFNSVLMAGGAKNGGSGSHILELKIGDFNGLTVTQWPFDFSISGGTVTGMAFNKFFPNIFYAITSNGKFYKSINMGQNFTEKSGAINNAHYLYGHEILCSKNDPDVIYIAGSGYSNAPIYKSIDGGDSFFSIKNNLPSTTVYDIAIDSEGEFIFAATEAGAFVYIEDLEEWFDLGQSKAPNQSYWSVEFLQNLNKVRFGTYGRGIWDLDLQLLSDTEEEFLAQSISIYPNPSSRYLNLSFDKEVKNIKVINSNGQLMDNIQFEYNVQNIDIGDFPNGIYYIIFESSKSLVTKKFVKI